MHQPRLCLPEDQTCKRAPFEGSYLPRGRDLCSSALNRTLVNLLRLYYKAPISLVPLINKSHSYSRKSYLWLLASISFLFKACTHPSIWSREIKHTFPITNQMAFRKISFFSFSSPNRYIISPHSQNCYSMISQDGQVGKGEKTLKSGFPRTSREDSFWNMIKAWFSSR